jgi:hypothetical protein
MSPTMSVSVFGSQSQENIEDGALVNHEAKLNATHGAEELDNALRKREPASDANGNVVNEIDDEIKKLESGGFRPHASPHINWRETRTSVTEERDYGRPSYATSYRSNSSVDGNGPGPHPFGRGGASRRRSSVKEPPISREAAELARAEAASWAQMTPLMAATLGPLSVLLGIPTLTQRWHGIVLYPPLLPDGESNFISLPDPTLNLVLSGIILFCEVMGNTLLILRFSNFHTKITTWVSYGFWWIKIIVGMANYIEFGIMHPETDEIIYLEGFWVISNKLVL